jgi:hypothetical protein
MRRFATAAIASMLLATALASTTMADTGPNGDRFEFDRVQGSFAFSQGGRDFDGQIFIDRDTATGTAIASFYYASGVIVTCDNGTPGDTSDDFEEQDLIDFTANEAPPATLSIGTKQASASSSATAQGSLKHYEACTNGFTSEPLTVAWQISLLATGPAKHTTTVSRLPNDDGTVTKQTTKTDDRPSGGTITFNARSIPVTPGSVSHILIVETTE